MSLFFLSVAFGKNDSKPSSSNKTKSNPEIQSESAKGNISLYSAIRDNNIVKVKEFLENDETVDCLDFKKAIQKDHTAILKLLTKARSIDKKCYEEDILIFAIELGNLKNVRRVVYSMQPKPNERSFKGEIPFIKAYISRKCSNNTISLEKRC